MSKIITLKCPDCLATKSFKVGADSDLQTLKDAVARVTEERDSKDLLSLLGRVESKKPKSALYNFYINHAEYLTNINYALFGGVHMFTKETLEGCAEYTRLMAPPVSDKIRLSKHKWAVAAAIEGVLAFNGIFYCRKCGTFENRLFIRVRYLDGKKEIIYVLPQRCHKCGDHMQLVDDDNCGFIHEGLETIGKCDACGGHYKVETVSFSPKPAVAQTAATPPAQN